MTTTELYSGIGNKNSSRVLAAPGGKSSISFGGPDDSPPAPPRRSTESSQNQSAVNDSPAGQGVPGDHNSHSAIFGSEAGDAGTPEDQKVKRVSKGQGRYNPQTGDGQCSGFNPVTGEDFASHDGDKVSPRQKYANDQTRDLIGSFDDDNNSGMQASRASSARVYKNSQYRGAYNPITGELYEDSPKITEGGGKAQSEQGGRGDFNPITGEAYVPKKEVHTSTRVRQPPGGASSKLW